MSSDACHSFTLNSICTLTTTFSLKITVIENLDYFVAVSKEGDGAPAANEFSGYIIDMIDAVSKKAGFTYELLLPSGKGESCSPVLGTDGTEEYAAVYRPQFSKFTMETFINLLQDLI